MKVVRSSPLRTGRLHPYSPAVFTPRNILVLDPRAHGTVWCPGKNTQWPEIDPGTLRLVAQCLNHYATPGPIACLALTYFFTLSQKQHNFWKCFIEHIMCFDFLYNFCPNISHSKKNWVRYKHTKGHAVVQLVEALRYKLEGRGFDSPWCHWNFSLI